MFENIKKMLQKCYKFFRKCSINLKQFLAGRATGIPSSAKPSGWRASWVKCRIISSFPERIFCAGPKSRHRRQANLSEHTFRPGPTRKSDISSNMRIFQLTFIWGTLCDTLAVSEQKKIFFASVENFPKLRLGGFFFDFFGKVPRRIVSSRRKYVTKYQENVRKTF